MKKRLNIRTKSGKLLKTGAWLGAFFAFATILSSFGTGSLPQINSISDALFDSFGFNKIATGAVLALLLGAVIIGGIKRIAKVTSTLVPVMALFYFLGALFVIGTNYENIIPSFLSIFKDAFTGSAAVGGFLGAGFAFTFNKGVNRGLFSNEAGQGSAPIAHSAAKAHEPVSEGMVTILEPFIDTIIICTLTGLVLLSSGVWNEKLYNRFEDADLSIVSTTISDETPEERQLLKRHIFKKESLPLFTGELEVVNGKVQNEVSFIHARSLAENVEVKLNDTIYSGKLSVANGKVIPDASQQIHIWGLSLIHSAPLTTEAFKRSFLGNYGQYIVAIGLLLFAFSTAISWSYYGGRAVTYLFGVKYVMVYRLFYVVAFFFAAFTDTTIVWNLSYITIAIMTIPNLVGLWILHRDIKTTIQDYWVDFQSNWPGAKIPKSERKV